MTESESTLHYFAYGSNNHVPHLRMWLVMHGINHQDHVSEIRHAILHNYRLRTTTRPGMVQELATSSRDLEQSLRDCS